MNSRNWSRDTLRQSFKTCDRIMADRAKSFYQAFRLLPSDRFRAVAALYAFNRYVDDLVDNDIVHHDRDEVVSRLNQQEACLSALYEATAQPDETDYSYFYDMDWWPAFEQTVLEYGIPFEPLVNQIRGQMMDLESYRIQTIDDLLTYSGHVAGSVGIMMLPLLLKRSEDFSNPDLQKACMRLGIGMQLTNILRDVGEDYRKFRRIYIPEELLKKHNVDAALIAELAVFEGDPDALAARIPQNFVTIWEDISQIADHHYQDIVQYIQYFHSSARFPLMAAAYSYHGIADAVRDSVYNCFTQRNYTSPSIRSELIAKAKQFLAAND